MTTPSLPTETSPPETRPGFGERLSAIRVEGRARSERDRAHRSANDMLRTQELMRSFAFLADVEQAAVTLLEDLALELPVTAKVARTVFDGRYQVFLRFEETLRDRDGQTLRAFSRVALLLEPKARDGRFSVECRSTVRSRDLSGDAVTVDMDAAGLERLRALFETRALAFAQHYFESSPYTRVSETDVDGSWLRDSLDT